MSEHEAAIAKERFEKYQRAKELRNGIMEALETMSKPVQIEASPFTGNTRESRTVESISINFSKTRGGALGVDLFISRLNIEACDFGAALRELLERKRDHLEKEMDEI